MEFKINDTIIPLGDTVSLPLVLRSPIFLTSESKIPGSYIFNFSVPAGNAIRTVFGQAHRAQRHERATAELPYTIADGMLRFSGNCVVTEATEDSYEIACKLGNGDLASRISSLTLKELDWGADLELFEFYTSKAITDEAHPFYEIQASPFDSEDILVFDAMAEDTSSSFSLAEGKFTAPRTSQYMFTMNMVTQVAIGTAQLNIYKNAVLYKELSLAAAENFYAENINLAQNDELTFTVFSVSAEDNGNETIDYTIDTDSYIEIIENKSNLTDIALGDQYDGDFVAFPVHNKEFLANFPDDAFELDNLSIKTIYGNYFPVLNYWVDGMFPLYLGGYAENTYFKSPNLFTPFIYLRSILNKIADSQGYAIINNPFDEAEFENAVLFNAYAENNYTATSSTLTPIKRTFNLVDHVPDVKQSDFIRYVSLLTGYMPVVDNNEMTITFVDIKTKSQVTTSNPAIDFPGIVLDSNKIKVAPEYNGIKLTIEKASSDAYLSRIKELNEKLVYKGEVEQINDLPPSGNTANDMYLVTKLDEYYVYQYNPETYSLTWYFYSKNYSIAYSEGEEPFFEVKFPISSLLTSYIADDSLMAPEGRSWRIPRTEQAGTLEGFPDSLGAEYGLQALIYKGMAKDSLDGDYPYAQAIYPADQLFENRYKEFLRWLAYETKPVTLKAVVNRSQLRRLKFEQVYHADGFNFLVKEVRVNLVNDGLSVAEMDVYTC